MKLPQIIFLFALFVAGFTLVWFVRITDGAVAAQQGNTSAQIRSSSSKPVEASRQNDDVRTESLLKDYLADLSPVIGKDDYRKMVEELFRNPDASGRFHFGSLMEKLMGEWYEADPDAALHCALTQKVPSRTELLLTAIVGGVARKDVEAALALAKRYGGDDGYHIGMPDPISNMLGKTNAEDLLRIAGLFKQVDGASGGSIEVAADFDFQQALEGLEMIEAGLGEGVTLSFTPSNLLTEWAKSDWDAAWKWALSGDKGKGADLAALAQSVAGTSSVEEYASLAVFVAQALARDPKNKNQPLWDIFAERATPELIGSYLEQAPGGRQENLTAILTASMGYRGDSYDNAQQVLLWQMTPAERVTAFQSESVRQYIDKQDWEYYHSMLRRLGHNDAEIRQMLPTL